MGNVGRQAVHSVIAINRMATLAGRHASDVMRLREDLQQYKEESARVRRPLVLCT